MPHPQCASARSLQLGQDHGRGGYFPSDPRTAYSLSFYQFVGSRLYEMRASVQASKLGYTPSTPVAEVKDFSALGFTAEVTVGDETKMPLIQRLLQNKMSSADAKDQVGIERDIISEAMGHLYVPSRSVDDY